MKIILFNMWDISVIDWYKHQFFKHKLLNSPIEKGVRGGVPFICYTEWCFPAWGSHLTPHPSSWALVLWGRENLIFFYFLLQKKFKRMRFSPRIRRSSKWRSDWVSLPCRTRHSTQWLSIKNSNSPSFTFAKKRGILFPQHFVGEALFFFSFLLVGKV